jgi:hypothetical protein
MNEVKFEVLVELSRKVEDIMGRIFMIDLPDHFTYIPIGPKLPLLKF